MRERSLGWLWRPAPAARLASVRILVGGFALVYLIARAPHLASPANFGPDRFVPIGVVSILDRPLPASMVWALVALAIVLAVPFVCGWRFRVLAPLFALTLLWVLTYRSSWAKIFHTENLLVWQVGILAVTRSADVWSLDARRGRGVAEGEHPRYHWPLQVMGVVVASSYLVAAASKVRYSGFDWLDPDWMRYWVAYDNLRKIALGDLYSPLGVALVPHGWVFAPLAAFAMLLEVSAPLALFGRRLAAWWVSAALSFHWGVLILMMVAFPFHMSGVPFAPYFRVERLLSRVYAWLGRGRGTP